jgi:hypothetical protein
MQLIIQHASIIPYPNSHFSEERQTIQFGTEREPGLSKR